MIEEKNIQKNDEIELDLGRIFRAIAQQGWFVALAAVIFAVVAFVGTFFLITPTYESAAMFYVNNSNLSLGDASVSISSGDLTTSRNLVDSYIVILNTRETLVDVIDYAGVARTYKGLREMISASAVDETEIFKVTVTSPDPNEAEKIANAIAYILPKRIGKIIDGTSAKVVDAASVPSAPSSPSYPKNTAIGFALGLLLSAGLIALREILDITIRTEEDVTQVCKYPILALVPDMLSPGKGGSYYYYSGKKKKGAYTPAQKGIKQPSVMGENMGFSAAEAYKLLRTKLQFSFADEGKSRVIGLSSALSGEGKSLTAVNLAYMLSQLNKKVILIDGDMRRPTLAEKVGVLKTPGLSSYLSGQCDLADLVQECDMKGQGGTFHIISAGQNPPNPIELLSSARMKTALASLRQTYDYTVLDLPPIGEVSDALAVANETDGILLVVRENYCDRVSLTETIQQFEFINAKLLGAVLNCTGAGGGKYGYSNHYYRRYYRRYYKSYYKRYGSAYANKYANHYANNDRSVAPAKEEE